MDDFENAPVTPISQRAEVILSEIKIVDLAIKTSKIKFIMPVLGAGDHDAENYKKRELARDTIKGLGHDSFFPEEVTIEDAKQFLRNHGIDEVTIEAMVGNDERKNDTLLTSSKIIVALATNDGTLVEIGKCCKTPNEGKLRVFVPENKYEESSQIMQTLNELKINHDNVYTFKDDADLCQQVKHVIALQIAKAIRND